MWSNEEVSDRDELIWEITGEHWGNITSSPSWKCYIFVKNIRCRLGENFRIFIKKKKKKFFSKKKKKTIFAEGRLRAGGGGG